MANNHSEVEKRLWDSADELRTNSKLKSSEYSVPVLGLIFLRYADHKFSEAQKEVTGKASVQQQFGRLDVQPADLEGRNARSAYVKTMFMAFREDGAKDWTSNLAISLSHSGKQHRLQFHHIFIFPRRLLKGHFKTQEVSNIANLAFIGGKTNRRISDKHPQEYFPQVVQKQGQSAFTAQCIPSDEKFLCVEKYPEFLAERRKLIAERLNRFLGRAKEVR